MAASDTRTGHVCTGTVERKQQQEFIESLDQRDREIAAEITKISLVMDNLRMHRGANPVIAVSSLDFGRLQALDLLALGFKQRSHQWLNQSGVTFCPARLPQILGSGVETIDVNSISFVAVVNTLLRAAFKRILIENNLEWEFRESVILRNVLKRTCDKCEFAIRLTRCR